MDGNNTDKAPWVIYEDADGTWVGQVVRSVANTYNVRDKRGYERVLGRELFIAEPGRIIGQCPARCLGTEPR